MAVRPDHLLEKHARYRNHCCFQGAPFWVTLHVHVPVAAATVAFMVLYLDSIISLTLFKNHSEHLYLAVAIGESVLIQWASVNSCNGGYKLDEQAVQCIGMSFLLHTVERGDGDKIATDKMIVDSFSNIRFECFPLLSIETAAWTTISVHLSVRRKNHKRRLLLNLGTE